MQIISRGFMVRSSRSWLIGQNDADEPNGASHTCDDPLCLFRPSPQHPLGRTIGMARVFIALVSEPAFGRPASSTSRAAAESGRPPGADPHLGASSASSRSIRSAASCQSTVTSDDRAMYCGSTSSSGSAPTGARRHIADAAAMARRVAARGQSTAQIHRRCSGRRFSAIRRDQPLARGRQLDKAISAVDGEVPSTFQPYCLAWSSTNCRHLRARVVHYLFGCMRRY